MVDILNNITNTKLNNGGMVVDFSRPQTSSKISKSETDSVEIKSKQTGLTSDKKKKIYTYSAIGGGIILAILAFLKRKSISRFVKNMFGMENPRPPRGDSPSPESLAIPPNSSGGGGGGASSSASIHTPRPPHGHGGAPSVEDLRELERIWAHMPNGNPHKAQLGRKITELEKTLKESNVSFVPKAPETFVNEAEKIKYIQQALLEADVNEASAMDALSVFEKYGSRYTYGPNNSKNIRTGISDLALAIDKISGSFDGEIADRAISKYLDLFNKFARSDGEYTDTRHLRLLIERHHSKMSEDTVMKMIDTLKKFSFEKAQAWSVRRYVVDDAYTKRTPEELSRINERLKELEEIVKDMPMKDKRK